MNKLSLIEKVGYGMGDAAANLVWRGALAYLAVFYTDTFGLSVASAALLFLIVRLSDGVTDIVMGMIADRTQTAMGRFRPWILWSTPLLCIFMVLCFTTPDLDQSGKLWFAYITYIGLTLAYTMNNVPYSALMGVMTPDDRERTQLSGFRFAGAFLGGLFVMGFLPSLVDTLGAGSKTQGYQYAMFVYAGLLFVMMMFTVWSTRERIVPIAAKSMSLTQELGELAKQLPFIVVPLSAVSAFFYFRNWLSGAFLLAIIVLVVMGIRRLKRTDPTHLSRAKQDVLDLASNTPWLILLGIGFLTMMFNGIKIGAVAYYFKYYVGDELLAGQYFIGLLVISVIGALATSTMTRWVGRKALFIIALIASSVLTALLYFVPEDQLIVIFSVGISAEFFAAIMPTLFFAMLGDAADYSEWRTGRRATGLIFSAGTFVQKTGGGFAGALMLLVLGFYGYDGADISTVDNSIPGMILLMSFIPAVFGVLGALLMMAYPLNDRTQQQITAELTLRRSQG